MISQNVIDDFHRREFGEEMARVNALPKAERWAYVRQLWQRLRQRQQDGQPVSQAHGQERVWGEQTLSLDLDIET